MRPYKPKYRCLDPDCGKDVPEELRLSMETPEGRTMYKCPGCRGRLGQVVYVVATVILGDRFGDVVLVTGDESHARTVKYTVKERRPLPGMNYAKLASFDDVIYFERVVDKLLCNEERNHQERKKV